jgi:DNA-binding CsgD family transcriptional regulator
VFTPEPTTAAGRLGDRYLQVATALRTAAATAGVDTAAFPPVPARRADAEVLSDLGVVVAELRRRLLTDQSDTQARVRDELAALGGFRSVAEILDAAPRALCVAAGFDRALISSVRGSTWLPLRLHVERGAGDPVNVAFSESLRGRAIPLTSTMPEAEVLRRRAPALVLDAQAEPGLFRPFVEVSGAREYVVASVQADDAVLGLVHADRQSSGRPLSAADRDLAQAFADGLGLLIERAVAVERLTLQHEQVAAALSAAHAASAGLAAVPPRLERAVGSATPIDEPRRLVLDGPTALPRPLDCLTPREHDVLRQLASGATNAEIATRLTVSETTVKSHVKHILRKLRAANRAEAIARYLHLVRDQARAL